MEVIKTEKSDKYDEFLHKLQYEVMVGSIGPITGKALEQYDIPAIEADRYTVKDMIDALLQKI